MSIRIAHFDREKMNNTCATSPPSATSTGPVFFTRGGILVLHEVPMIVKVAMFNSLHSRGI
jgi:hypothetical protein